MIGYRRLLLVLCLLVFALSGVHAARLKMPPGAYFTKPVADVDQLCEHIQEDPVVAARFTKHFGMSTPELVSYFKQHFWMKKLTKTARYVEYFVDTRGRMVSHVKLLRAGTVVFVNYDGKPVLDLKCGNPLTKTLPRPMVKAQPVTKVAQAQQETPPAPPPAQEIVIEPAPVEEPPAPIPAPPVPVIEPEPVTQVLGAAPQEITFSPANLGRAAAVLLPLLGAGAVSGGDDAVPPVPEPSSMAILLTGVTGLLATRRFRR